MNDQTFYIFDFDSTIIQTEALEELAKIVLENDPDRIEKCKEIEHLTELGMEGKIPFHESLSQRIALLHPSNIQVDQLAHILSKKIDPSFLEHRYFFEASEDAVYVVSGGFREFIVPVVKKLGISSNCVFANSFIFNDEGKFQDIDHTNPLSREGGKVELIRSLKLGRDGFMIGDGMSDAQVKEAGLVRTFIAYTATTHRPAVVDKGDYIAQNFEEVLDVLTL